MTGGTVLVIGGAGYIGSHMVRALRSAGIAVRALDDLSTGHRALCPPECLFEGDLGDETMLDRLFQTESVTAVMHFAAFSQVGESVREPVRYYENNVAKTVHLLRAMLRNGVERFIFSSTAAVYGEPECVPIPESHPCRPTNPYGATKLAVERMLADLAAATPLRYMSLRYFNAAGADESAEIGERHRPETHLIPLVLQTALGEHESVSIFGIDYPTEDGTCVRDYVHVNDLTAAHLLALRALEAGRASAVYNLGNSRGYSVREVIATARRVTGCAIAAREGARRAGDPAVLVADSGAIRRALGWRPRFEALDSIVASAWNWHRREHRSAESATGA